MTESANSRVLLVTGGAGFIGTNFVLTTLANDFARIVNLDKLTYAANRETFSHPSCLAGDPRHLFVEGDICDRPLITRLLAENRVTAIVNFAAESHVDRSIDSPGAFVQTNIVGAFELLEAARAYRASLSVERAQSFRFLHVSTDEVFGSLGATGAFTEASPYAPNSPYAASKAAADHLVRAYHHTYGLPTITTNCSNNYGPYQFPEKLIPLVILNALDGRALPIYGDGLNVRDWLFVEDHCDALRLALERGTPGDVYAIGGRSELSNIELVHRICDLLDELAPRAESYRSLISHVRDRPGHDRRYAMNPEKIERELGFRPAHRLEEGLRQTVLWYLENREWCTRISERTYKRERLGLAKDLG